jgi:hypothetical protein
MLSVTVTIAHCLEINEGGEDEYYKPFAEVTLSWST